MPICSRPYPSLTRFEQHDPSLAQANSSRLPGRRLRPGRVPVRRGRQGLSRRERWRRRVLPRPPTSGGAGRDACAARQAGLCAHQFFHERSGRSAGGRTDFARTGQHVACVPGVGRIGSGRGRAQNGAAVFRRARRNRTQAFHRAPPELSRQYPGRAGGRRQCLAASAVCADPDRQ